MEAAVCCTLKNYCVYMGHIFANSVDPPTHQNLFVSHVQNTQSGILNSLHQFSTSFDGCVQGGDNKSHFLHESKKLQVIPNEGVNHLQSAAKYKQALMGSFVPGGLRREHPQRGRLCETAFWSRAA